MYNTWNEALPVILGGKNIFKYRKYQYSNMWLKSCQTSLTTGLGPQRDKQRPPRTSLPMLNKYIELICYLCISKSKLSSEALERRKVTIECCLYFMRI